MNTLANHSNVYWGGNSAAQLVLLMKNGELKKYDPYLYWKDKIIAVQLVPSAKTQVVDNHVQENAFKNDSNLHMRNDFDNNSAGPSRDEAKPVGRVLTEEFSEAIDLRLLCGSCKRARNNSNQVKWTKQDRRELTTVVNAAMKRQEEAKRKRDAAQLVELVKVVDNSEQLQTFENTSNAHEYVLEAPQLVTPEVVSGQQQIVTLGNDSPILYWGDNLEAPQSAQREIVEDHEQMNTLANHSNVYWGGNSEDPQSVQLVNMLNNPEQLHTAENDSNVHLGYISEAPQSAEKEILEDHEQMNTLRNHSNVYWGGSSEASQLMKQELVDGHEQMDTLGNDSSIFCWEDSLEASQLLKQKVVDQKQMDILGNESSIFSWENNLDASQLMKEKVREDHGQMNTLGNDSPIFCWGNNMESSQLLKEKVVDYHKQMDTLGNDSSIFNWENNMAAHQLMEENVVRNHEQAQPYVLTQSEVEEYNFDNTFRNGSSAYWRNDFASQSIQLMTNEVQDNHEQVDTYEDDASISDDSEDTGPIRFSEETSKKVLNLISFLEIDLLQMEE